MSRPAPQRFCVCGCGTAVGKRYVFAKGHGKRVPNEALPNPNPSGLCGCGCGGTTGIAARTDAKLDRYKGRHVRFLPGHGSRLIEGAKSSRWKGGRILTGEGYVKVRVTLPDGSRAYVSEHRYVMEQHLGRPLRTNEQVHHKNGEKTDNRVENLELWSRSHPDGIRVTGLHCPGCTCSA